MKSSTVDANQTMAMLENIGLAIRTLHDSLGSLPTPMPAPTSSTEVMRVDDVFARMEEMSKRLDSISDVVARSAEERKPDARTLIEKLIADGEKLEFRTRIKYVKRWFLCKSLFVATTAPINSRATKSKSVDGTARATYDEQGYHGTQLGMRGMRPIPFLTLLDMLVPRGDGPVNWQKYAKEPIYAIAKNALRKWDDLSMAVLREMENVSAVCARPGLLKAYASEIIGMFSDDPTWRRNLTKILPCALSNTGKIRTDHGSNLKVVPIPTGRSATDFTTVEELVGSGAGNYGDTPLYTLDAPYPVPATRPKYIKYIRAVYSIFYDPEP